MRVMLSLEIKLTELPTEEPQSDEPIEMGGDEPMAMLGKMAGQVLKIGSPGTIFPMPRQPGGLDFRRTAILGCGTFPTLVEILDKYNQLTSELEKAWP